VPIGLEDKHIGVLDIVAGLSLINQGALGETVIVSEISNELRPSADAVRRQLVDTLAEIDDEVAEHVLNDVDPWEIPVTSAIRRHTLTGAFVPVCMYKRIDDQVLTYCCYDWLGGPRLRTSVFNHFLMPSLHIYQSRLKGTTGRSQLKATRK
jgi:translation elongation factor EF-G